MLKADAGLEVIGEAATLAETFELVDLPKPDTVLIDLHMPDETLHAPEAAEVKMLQNAGCILAISVWNDYEAKALAEQFGAKRH
jgi:DNA-binding NarL/FixJ family response regulator